MAFNFIHGVFGCWYFDEILRCVYLIAYSFLKVIKPIWNSMNMMRNNENTNINSECNDFDNHKEDQTVIIMILILVSEFRAVVDWHVINWWNHMVCMVNDTPPYCLGKDDICSIKWVLEITLSGSFVLQFDVPNIWKLYGINCRNY